MYYISGCDFTAGWVSGICGLLIGHPAETIKVRQQTGKQSFIESLVVTSRKEGIGGFYKGILFPLLTTGITNAVFFGFFANSLRIVSGHDGKLCCENRPNDVEYWHSKVFLSGCIGGLAFGVVACPIEVIKTRLQVDKGSPGAFQVLQKVYKISGFRGLYKGYITMLIRDVPGFGIYALTYEHAVCVVRRNWDKKKEHIWIGEIIGGGLAGVFSWIFLMPVDFVKSRIQSDDLINPKYKGILDCFGKVYKKDGAAIFFKGISVTVLRAFPTNAVTYTVYSRFSRWCEINKRHDSTQK